MLDHIFEKCFVQKTCHDEIFLTVQRIVRKRVSLRFLKDHNGGALLDMRSVHDVSLKRVADRGAVRKSVFRAEHA